VPDDKKSSIQPLRRKKKKRKEDKKTGDDRESGDFTVVITMNSGRRDVARQQSGHQGGGVKREGELKSW